MINPNKRKKQRRKSLEWFLHHLFVPLSIAVIAGLFALEVIDRQVEGQTTRAGSQATQVHNIVQTLSAMTPETYVITETVLITAVVTPEVAEVVVVTSTPTLPIPAPSCGLVPIGWQLYYVNWGDTLYSLSRRSGATIAEIRRANCLGELKANTNIWLPSFVQPAPVTRIVEEDTEPPGVSILTPVDGSIVTSDSFSTTQDGGLWYTFQELNGVAFDSQDGTLAEDSLVWTTDQTAVQHGILGVGSIRAGQLFGSPCEVIEHTIRLTATDSAGNIGYDEVTIRIDFIDAC